MSPSRYLEIPALHSQQTAIVSNARRYNVVACGRRFGKSWLGMDRLIDKAIQAQPVAWFSPTYRMLSEAWRMVREALQPVTTTARADEHRIELLGGGTVDMWSLDNPDTARGRKYARVVIDEAAIAPTLEDAWTNVIRPTLTDLRGDAWFMSTPRGHNYFWRLWQQGQDAGNDWRSWQMPTTANPYIDPREVAAARQDIPERVFAQEYLAEFIDDAGAVFRRVYEVQTAEPVAEAEPGANYVLGIDWGKHNDFTVLCVLDADNRQQVALDRFNKIDYRFQLGRVKVMLNRFPGAWVIAEANSIGDPLIEQLRADGVRVQPFITTPSSKTRIIENLALALENGELALLADATQTSELLAFTADRLPGGGLRYSAPPGGHDDTVIALAIAWSGVDARLPATIPSRGDPFAGLQQPTAGHMELRQVDGRIRWGISQPARRKNGGLNFGRGGN